ncbi:MAG: hypothetical protein GEV28_04320 [Actinophytocola sp.]|uniref:recombinase family protein n=1 Tax=Actinophytocola sp. TaxID=1872138 RepID=UPI001321EF5B|nr:recombinase family protein [Actinophytocola sp.]MPZ79650.1 hypothetical protein [Actinophytocola sp.]
MSTRSCCRPRWRRLWHRWFGHPTTRPTHPDPAATDAEPAAASTTSPHATAPTHGELRASTADQIRSRIIAGYHAHTTRQARERIIALVRSGHHIGGAPYGYRAVHSHHRSGAAGTRLQPDPRTAPAVRAVYSWRLGEHLSLPAIVDRLTADPDHCPPPTDPATGGPRRWTVGIVHTILSNPVYTGRTVWGRTRHGRPVPPEHWITSGPGAHRALIDARTFAHAAATLAKHTPAARGGVIQRDLIGTQREDGWARHAGHPRGGSGVPESGAA